MTDVKIDPLCWSGISCHSFSPDRKQIAVSPSNNEVRIYECQGEKASNWKMNCVLKEHDSFVSGIDWSPINNMIVTCAHDRNAYVWKYEKDQWKPTLVILRLNRGATMVKWSPNGKKFATSSTAKAVSICHYEKSNDWWISKMIKKHKSTVLAVDWHPNNKIICTGCTDRKCRIFSAYIEEVDDKSDADVFVDTFPNQFEFGECLAEFDQGRGWVNACVWSPSGFRMAFTSHDSSIHFVQLLSGNPPEIQTQLVGDLPYRCLTFIDDKTVVAAGWDCGPHLFTASGGDADPKWSFNKRLDGKGKAITSSASKAPEKGFAGARNIFEGASNQGHSIERNAGGIVPISLDTRHQNCVSTITVLGGRKFATSGVDGQLLFWNA